MAGSLPRADLSRVDVRLRHDAVISRVVYPAADPQLGMSLPRGRDLHMGRSSHGIPHDGRLHGNRARARMGTLNAQSITARRPRWRSYLRLARVSNLPTVWSNALAGMAANSPALDWNLYLQVAAAISFLYMGG